MLISGPKKSFEILWGFFLPQDLLLDFLGLRRNILRYQKNLWELWPSQICEGCSRHKFPFHFLYIILHSSHPSSLIASIFSPKNLFIFSLPSLCYYSPLLLCTIIIFYILSTILFLKISFSIYNFKKLFKYFYIYLSNFFCCSFLVFFFLNKKSSDLCTATLFSKIRFFVAL